MSGFEKTTHFMLKIDFKIMVSYTEVMEALCHNSQMTLCSSDNGKVLVAKMSALFVWPDPP